MSADVTLVADLFACAGGATEGYRRAGWRVFGVDIVARDEYPEMCYEADVIKDGLAILRDMKPDFVHASPPCQANTPLTKGNRSRPGWVDDHVDLIPATREILEEYGAPYVIENTNGADMRRDWTACGEMFGLGVIRHRHFEFGHSARAPRIDHVPHRGRTRGWRHGVYYDGPYLAVYGKGGGKGSIAEWQEAMGITHISTRLELAEAIPPAYTEAIARAQ